ncbi:MAG: metallophosphoesterase [Pseudomonadota bacterium]|nr:metallophosphoesterase [Pseudomonadota bacterium]
MSILAHLSDLHFGRVDERLLTPLVAAVEAAKPDVVVVSGDLTQRAQKSEFRAARDFLARLPGPRVVVPGNHDVPLYNVFDRLARPLALFREIIEADPMPRFVDGQLAVIGVNSARSLVVKDGRINEEQIDAIRAAFSALPPDVFRVVVTHHPFDAGPAMDPGDRIGRAGLALRAFAECGVDLLLSGHLHVAYSGESAPVSGVLAGHEALAVSAGTATSTRVRGDPNEFNVLRVSKRRVEVETHAWIDARNAFEQTRLSTFERMDLGWRNV